MKKLLYIIFIITPLFFQCKKQDIDNNNSIVYPKLNGPEGSTKNLFSISESKMVYFSKGNLQYQASTNGWRFADHQWDVIGENNVNISPTYNGWIDLFLYGSSGYNGIYPYLPELPENLIEVGAIEISGTNYDWGVYNPIKNGGNQAGLWRVLTKEEMVFLLSRRDSRGNWLSGKGCLIKKDGIRDNGLFIMPDNYISHYSYPYDWEIDVNDLNGYGGVFISALSGMLGQSTDTVLWYESNPLLHVSALGEFKYDDSSVNDSFRIASGVFWIYRNRTLNAVVRLVQDY